jgi:CHAT domain-containing protein
MHLASAFQAGAAGVIGTLWPVDDISTALIMMKFYEPYVSKNTQPALALRRAQLWLRDADRRDIDAFLAEMLRLGRLSGEQDLMLRKSLRGASAGKKPYAHPYYWAAFQFYGS